MSSSTDRRNGEKAAVPFRLRPVPSRIGQDTGGSAVSLNYDWDMRDSAALIREAREARSAQLDRAVRGG